MDLALADLLEYSLEVIDAMGTDILDVIDERNYKKNTALLLAVVAKNDRAVEYLTLTSPFTLILTLTLKLVYFWTRSPIRISSLLIT